MTKFAGALSALCLVLATPAFGADALEQAKEMLAKAEAMRAEATDLEAQAKALMAEAEEAASAAATAAAATAAAASTETAEADDDDDEEEESFDNISVSYEEDGKYFTEDDIPTFNVKEDGAVDWYTFSGFRRYHAECHVCHGPDGEGSTYAPALKKSALDMDYYDFYDTVVNGRKSGNSVMPMFGDNPNVMCYLDDIYIYLKAHGSEAIGRGRPKKKDKKSQAFVEAQDACLGG